MDKPSAKDKSSLPFVSTSGELSSAVWELRVERLRQLLLQTCSALGGQNAGFDQCLEDLRRVLHQEALDDSLAALIPRLEQAVWQYQQQQQQQAASWYQQLSGMAGQLMALNPPKGVRSALRILLRDTEQMPGISLEGFERLASLHAQTLTLWRPEPYSPEVLGRRHLNSERLGAYESVSNNIERVLQNMLRTLHLPAEYSGDINNLHARLDAGLSWYELVPVLDDLVALMHVFVEKSQRNFDTYLDELGTRLSGLQLRLEDVRQQHHRQANRSASFDQQLQEQLTQMHVELQDLNDPELMKGLLAQRMKGLQQTVDYASELRRAYNQYLDEHLQFFHERLASLEQAALSMRITQEQQRTKSMVDALTGLPNRAAWVERVEMEVDRFRRYGGDLALVILDVDYFKAVNDRYGHLAGDRVLASIARLLRKRLRKTDFIARYGGEEFALLLPHTSEVAVRKLVEDLREKVAAYPFHFKGDAVEISVSIGFSIFSPDDEASAVFERADQALYQAKSDGRNCIVQA